MGGFFNRETILRVFYWMTPYRDQGDSLLVRDLFQVQGNRRLTD